jgi:hypothetical protein
MMLIWLASNAVADRFGDFRFTSGFSLNNSSVSSFMVCAVMIFAPGRYAVGFWIRCPTAQLGSRLTSGRMTIMA